jgi:hypothetical protein
MSEIWVGLFSGIVFGFIITRIGATNPHRMARAHLMIDPDIPMFMLLAVVFSAWGLWGLVSYGVGTESVLPTSLVATGVAAVVFGVGWGLAGYCPGTTWAAVGEGRMDAVAALLGGLVGTVAFAHVHEWIIPLLYDPTNVGRLTLGDWLGTRLAAILVLTALFVGGVFAIGGVWKQRPRL